MRTCRLKKILIFFLSIFVFMAFSCDKKEDKSPSVKKQDLPKTELSANQSVKNLKKSDRIYIDPVTRMEFVFVKGGCFMMGDIFGDGDPDEKPSHNVCVDGFYMSKFETTQNQWKKLIGHNPAIFQYGVNYPVENVSWFDVQDFIEKLNSVTGRRYRLPTEAEWEYAARSGGKNEKFAGFSDEADLFKYTNFCDRNCESGSEVKSQNDRYKDTAPAGRFRPNGLGLYDMTGNVWEWVQDWYDESYYNRSPKLNPKGPESGLKRVIRGGSWDYDPRSLRVIDRDGLEPDKRSNNGGFRLVLPIK